MLNSHSDEVTWGMCPPWDQSAVARKRSCRADRAWGPPCEMQEWPGIVPQDIPSGSSNASCLTLTWKECFSSAPPIASHRGGASAEQTG